MTTAADLPSLKFAAVRLDHRHIYDQVQSLIDVGGECVGFWTQGTPKTLEGFVKRFPHIPPVADRARLLDDASIQLFACAAIPCDRAAHAIEAMRSGKDFMADKPGVTTLEQLDRVRGVQRETGRLYTVNFTERFEVRAVTRALELVHAGAIGDVVQTGGLGPHDIAGRPGKDHLFLVDGKGVRHIDCSDAKLPYHENLRRDIVERTETAMPHAHCYKVCELALKAQTLPVN